MIIPKRKVIVIGSTNTDMIINTNHFPNPGETVIGRSFLMSQGGKGANQAVAASRMNAKVVFVSRLGDDVFGKESLRNLKKENIDISYVEIDAIESTGIALITVDKNAENNIVVAPGANSKLILSNFELLKKIITKDSIVLIQLEIPIDTVKTISKFTKDLGALLVLNPAPALTLSQEILLNVDIITPNQKEASLLSNIEIVDEDTADLAAKRIHSLGPKVVIITMGSKGALLFSGDESLIIPSYPVTAVDTTAAGDVFNGSLVAAIAEGMTIKEAVKRGCMASAIAVTRRGAQPSIPTLTELEEYYKNYNS